MKLINSFKFSRAFAISTLCLWALSQALFGSWTNWRGPNFNGSSSTTSSLPAHFDKSKGVKWKAKLPGASAATPIVHDGLVFLPSVKVSTNSSSRGKGELFALCLSAEDGKILWQKSAGSGYKPGESDGFDYQLHDRSNYASPSPVIGGDSVFFFFGNGDLICYSLKGKENWRRNLQQDYGDFCFQWTFSASPTFYKGMLYLPILQRDEKVHGRGLDSAPSFLVCINPSDGKTIWKHVRKSPAQKESLESFGTIIPHNNQLIVAGGDVLTGHDPLNGKELWRWGTWNPGHKEQWWRLVPSPVIGDGVCLVCAPKRAPIFAVKLDQKQVSSGANGLRWNTAEDPMLTSDVPTPLFYRKMFFVLSDLRKILACVNPKTGKSKWSLELPGKYKWRGSPTAGDGKIYLMNHNGTVLVVSSESGKIINRSEMGGTYDDNTRSSIAISDRNLYIRTNENLYCIE
jgi:outer membrane protein assembly factor BamB